MLRKELTQRAVRRERNIIHGQREGFRVGQMYTIWTIRLLSDVAEDEIIWKVSVIGVTYEGIC